MSLKNILTGVAAAAAAGNAARVASEQQAAAAAAEAARAAGAANQANYLGLLRQIGERQAESQIGANREIDDINRGLGVTLADMAAGQSKTKENIKNSFLSRGMFRSGAYQKSVAEADDAYGRRYGDVTGGASTRASRIMQDLARKEASLNQERSEAALRYGF